MFVYEKKRTSPPCSSLTLTRPPSALTSSRPSWKSPKSPSIATHEYPLTWPALLPKLLTTIQSGNHPANALRVHNALIALRKICKRYEFKSKDERGLLNGIVKRSFHLPLAQRLVDPR